MPFSLDPNCGIGKWVFTAAGDPDPYIVTCGFRADTEAHFQSFISTMGSSWVAHLRSSTSSDQELIQTEGLWSPDGVVIKNFLSSVASIGTGGTGVLPSNCSVLVKKVTGFSGRANNGRQFWPNGIIARAGFATLLAWRIFGEQSFSSPLRSFGIRLGANLGSMVSVGRVAADRAWAAICYHFKRVL